MWLPDIDVDLTFLSLILVLVGFRAAQVSRMGRMPQKLPGGVDPISWAHQVWASWEMLN